MAPSTCSRLAIKPEIAFLRIRICVCSDRRSNFLRAKFLRSRRGGSEVITQTSIKVFTLQLVSLVAIDLHEYRKRSMSVHLISLVRLAYYF